MTNKQELHDELDALIPYAPDGERSPFNIVRGMGHCLIELGLVTSIECAYEYCKMDDRKFERDPSHRNGGRKWVTLDHVVEVCDGGTELPSNFQLMHLGCNASKGSKAYIADPIRRKTHSETSKKNWQDPVYAKKIGETVKTALADPEVKAKRSAAMKAHWADPERRKRHTASNQKAWDSLQGEEARSLRARGKHSKYVQTSSDVIGSNHD